MAQQANLPAVPAPVEAPLTPTQKTQPFAMTWAAIVMMVIGLGWKAFQAQDSETADQVTSDHTSEVAQIMGIITILGGSILHKRNEQKQETAVDKANLNTKVAAAAPPVTVSGDTCPYHTLSVGVQQLISRRSPGDLTAAKALLESLEKLEVSDA